MKYKTIDRQFTARLLNKVVNDPSVYDWVRGTFEGPMDLTPIVANHNNVLLMGEHGGILFMQHQQGLYEAHAQVVTAGRGKWATEMTQEALHWMFTRTDAVEIVTRVPRGNIGALALTKRMGFVLEFTRNKGWTKAGQPIPADVYSLKVQDWMRDAPGLKQRGDWFHTKLEAEYERIGANHGIHPDDDTHDQFVGATIDMIFGGQPQKATVFYNRWAVMAGYQPIRIMTLAPLTLDIQESLIAVRNDDFWVMACQ